MIISASTGDAGDAGDACTMGCSGDSNGVDAAVIGLNGGRLSA